MAEWVRDSGARVVVIFEGRDAAGKGGRSSGSRSTSTRASPGWSPCRSRPSARRPSGTSSATWSGCRPPARSSCSTAAGTTGPASRRSWASARPRSTAGSCEQCPIFERLLVGRRDPSCSSTGSPSATRSRPVGSSARIDDPMRRWKLSSTDLYSRTKWVDYSRAKDEMFVHTDIPEAPWFVVAADDKRRRADQLHRPPALPGAVRAEPTGPVQLPRRQPDQGYVRPPRDSYTLRARPRRHAGGLSRGGPACPVTSPTCTPLGASPSCWPPASRRPSGPTSATTARCAPGWNDPETLRGDHAAVGEVHGHRRRRARPLLLLPGLQRPAAGPASATSSC